MSTKFLIIEKNQSIVEKKTYAGKASLLMAPDGGHFLTDPGDMSAVYQSVGKSPASNRW